MIIYYFCVLLFNILLWLRHSIFIQSKIWSLSECFGISHELMRNSRDDRLNLPYLWNRLTLSIFGKTSFLIYFPFHSTCWQKVLPLLAVAKWHWSYCWLIYFFYFYIIYQIITDVWIVYRRTIWECEFGNTGVLGLWWFRYMF